VTPYSAVTFVVAREKVIFAYETLREPHRGMSTQAQRRRCINIRPGGLLERPAGEGLQHERAEFLHVAGQDDVGRGDLAERAEDRGVERAGPGVGDAAEVPCWHREPRGSGEYLRGAVVADDAGDLSGDAAARAGGDEGFGGRAGS
jgi:hypothetical protein